MATGLNPSATNGNGAPAVLALSEYRVELALSDGDAAPCIGRGETIGGPGDAARIARAVIGRRASESVLAIMLDSRHRVTGYAEVARGTVNAARLTPRDVFTPALLANAAAVVVAHNHPSGEPSPSSGDRMVTRALRAAAELLGLTLLDHVIVTADGGRFSFSDAEAWIDDPATAGVHDGDELREYPARCPVCAAEHVIRARFLSAAQYADGRARVSCGEHTAEEIAAAWDRDNPGVRDGDPLAYGHVPSMSRGHFAAIAAALGGAETLSPAQRRAAADALAPVMRAACPRFKPERFARAVERAIEAAAPRHRWIGAYREPNAADMAAACDAAAMVADGDALGQYRAEGASIPAGKRLEIVAAALRIADGFGSDTWHDLGPTLTCSEADALAELLRACGAVDSAAALDDDAGDAHYTGARVDDGDAPAYGDRRELVDRLAYLESEREAINSALDLLTASAIRAHDVDRWGETGGATLESASVAHAFGLDPDSERDAAAAVEQARAMRTRRSAVLREIGTLRAELAEPEPVAVPVRAVTPSRFVAVSGGRSIPVDVPEPVPVHEPVARAAETAVTAPAEPVRPDVRVTALRAAAPRRMARRPRFASYRPTRSEPVAAPAVGSRYAAALRALACGAGRAAVAVSLAALAVLRAFLALLALVADRAECYAIKTADAAAVERQLRRVPDAASWALGDGDAPRYARPSLVELAERVTGAAAAAAEHVALCPESMRAQLWREHAPRHTGNSDPAHRAQCVESAMALRVEWLAERGLPTACRCEGAAPAFDWETSPEHVGLQAAAFPELAPVHQESLFDGDAPGYSPLDRGAAADALLRGVPDLDAFAPAAVADAAHRLAWRALKDTYDCHSAQAILDTLRAETRRAAIAELTAALQLADGDAPAYPAPRVELGETELRRRCADCREWTHRDELNDSGQCGYCAREADSSAIDEIAALLSGRQWTRDDIDAVAEIVRGVGREIAAPSGPCCSTCGEPFEPDDSVIDGEHLACYKYAEPRVNDGDAPEYVDTAAMLAELRRARRARTLRRRAGRIADRPEPGKVYRLTGGPDDRAISNGDTWADSEVVGDGDRLTYRERRERRAERLRGWAGKREAAAAETFAEHERYRGDHAFNFQPGHIPERARVIRREDAAFASLRKAESMSSRADGIESQLARAIYSDDPDAIPALEARIAALEAERDRVKAYNATARKGRPDPSLLDAAQRADLAGSVRIGFAKPDGQFPGYVLANLGGNINRQKERLARLRRAAERGQVADGAAPAYGDVTVTRDPHDAAVWRVTRGEERLGHIVRHGRGWDVNAWHEGGLLLSVWYPGAGPMTKAEAVARVVRSYRPWSLESAERDLAYWTERMDTRRAAYEAARDAANRAKAEAAALGMAWEEAARRVVDVQRDIIHALNETIGEAPQSVGDGDAPTYTDRLLDVIRDAQDNRLIADLARVEREAATMSTGEIVMVANRARLRLNRLERTVAGIAADMTNAGLIPMPRPFRGDDFVGDGDAPAYGCDVDESAALALDVAELLAVVEARRADWHRARAAAELARQAYDAAVDAYQSVYQQVADGDAPTYGDGERLTILDLCSIIGYETRPEMIARMDACQTPEELESLLRKNVLGATLQETLRVNVYRHRRGQPTLPLDLPTRRPAPGDWFDDGKPRRFADGDAPAYIGCEHCRARGDIAVYTWPTGCLPCDRLGVLLLCPVCRERAHFGGLTTTMHGSGEVAETPDFGDGDASAYADDAPTLVCPNCGPVEEVQYIETLDRWCDVEITASGALIGQTWTWKYGDEIAHEGTARVECGSCFATVTRPDGSPAMVEDWS